jgi:hypothetical protein
MSLLIYVPAFWVIAIISSILQDRSAEGEKKLASLTTVIKLSPALTSVVYVLLTPASLTLFYILLAAALVFCMFGDVAMEVDLVPGIGMFLIAHIIYNVDFLWHASIAGLTTLPMAAAIICIGVMVVYVFMLIRALQSTGPEVPPFILRAGTVYFLLISATLSTSILLWLTTSNPLTRIHPGHRSSILHTVRLTDWNQCVSSEDFASRVVHHANLLPGNFPASAQCIYLRHLTVP